MGKRNKKRQEGEYQPSQQFDTTFKDWIRKSAAEILPLFLPDMVYEGPLDVEIIKPTMRTDRVFKVTSKELGEVNIVDVEFQVSFDPRLASRLLAYNAVLYHEYQVPVNSIVIYPFKTTKAGSPLVVGRGKKLITFDFVEIALYEENAQDYVDEHIFAMYPMLPTMQNADHILSQRAMDELEKHLHGHEGTFAERFVWMELVLDRTETISLPEKER